VSLPVHLTSLGASIESHQVEAVDPVFQTKMLEMLKQTGRPEMVVGKNMLIPRPRGPRQAYVGWYHSHPGFGCWMSGVFPGAFFRC